MGFTLTSTNLSFALRLPPDTRSTASVPAPEGPAGRRGLPTGDNQPNSAAVTYGAGLVDVISLTSLGGPQTFTYPNVDGHRHRTWLTHV